MKTAVKTIAGLLLCGFCNGLDAEDAARLRALGDAALKARDYKRAVGFYEEYKSAAGKDRNSLRDAYIRLLAAYISASDVPEAKRELAAFTKAFPFDDNKLKVLYRAGILMLERRYGDAETLLRSSLKEQPEKGDLHFQMLSTLGLSLRRQEHWREAAKVYAALELQAKGTSWEFTAFLQKLYCLIMGEELIKSRKLFAESKRFSGNPGYFEVKLLFLLQMIKEKKFSELRQTYAGVIKDIEPGPNPLVYKITQIAVKHFLKNDNPADAVMFLHDAFRFAPDERERRDSLLLLINTYVKTKQNSQAIRTALKYIQIYYDDPKTLNVQLQCARLMAAEKQFSEALAVYTAMLKEPRLTPAQRITVAREAALIYELNNDMNKAIRMLSIIYQTAVNTAERMEGKYLQGQVYYKNKNFAEAALAFGEAMAEQSPWQNRAAYWALLSQLHLKHYEKARYIAARLGQDKTNRVFAATGQYYLAYCQEKLGQTDAALKNYLLFAKLHPQSEFTPAALFAAGKILFAQRKYTEVVDRLKNFPAQYPKNEYTPNALYKTVMACYQLGKQDEMEKFIRLMERDYPDSDYCLAVEFWFIDCLRNRGRYEQAENWIREMLKKYAAKPEISAQLLYDGALVRFRAGKSREALQDLEELFRKYPQDNLNTNALFLAGDIASREGNYALAELYYRRAARLCPESDFEIACLGRMADCNYSLYNTTFDLKLLKKAAQGYKKLLDGKALSPSIRNQTKYKLGRCYELLNNENDALDLYNELLYDYQVDQEKGLKAKPVWVAKAADAAILMYLKMNTPEAAREAIRVYRLLKKMKLKTGEDFDGFIRNIQTKYSLEDTEN
ncbi:MAG: tetratricopeptide repeat protein [Victivallaceae bacterium]|nr:tetratricopeptide repeat protein [Victivallaceae bacterium]